MEEYNNIETLQASLESSPGDVALWIKLARLQLNQSNSDDKAENENMFENNVTQALSTLSRGLEENTESEVFVLCNSGKPVYNRIMEVT